MNTKSNEFEILIGHTYNIAYCTTKPILYLHRSIKIFQYHAQNEKSKSTTHKLLLIIQLKL